MPQITLVWPEQSGLNEFCCFRRGWARNSRYNRKRGGNGKQIILKNIVLRDSNLIIGVCRGVSRNSEL